LLLDKDLGQKMFSTFSVLDLFRGAPFGSTQGELPVRQTLFDKRLTGVHLTLFLSGSTAKAIEQEKIVGEIRSECGNAFISVRC